MATRMLIAVTVDCFRDTPCLWACEEMSIQATVEPISISRHMQSFVYSAKNKESINTVLIALSCAVQRMKGLLPAIFAKSRDDASWSPPKNPHVVNDYFL